MMLDQDLLLWLDRPFWARASGDLWDGEVGRDAVGAAVGLEELADSLGRAGTGKLR